MLRRLRSILEVSNPAQDIASDSDARHLAAAALMLHAATMDGALGARERDAIAGILEERFSLSREECAELLDEAERAEAESNELLRFTRTIKDACGHEERVALIEMLWEVVFADGEEHAYEANLLRRVAGLIYVTDQESGAARNRVRRRLGLDDA